MESKLAAAICVLVAVVGGSQFYFAARLGKLQNGMPAANNQYNGAAVQKQTDYSNEYELKVKNGIISRPNGRLDDKSITWVVENNGEVVFRGNARDEFTLDPMWCGIGPHKIWIDYDGNTVSNIIEWKTSIAEVETSDDGTDLKPIENTKYINTYKIAAKGGIVRRPNGIYDTTNNLGWTVELNGVEVLDRNAVDEFEIDPLWCGNGHYRIWLTAFLDGGYKRVSNIVEFDYPLADDAETGDFDDVKAIENTKYINAYKLTADAGLVTRTSGEYESSNISWKIVYNGVTKLERNAENETSYRPMNYGDGKYEVWLQAFIDGGYKRVSNKVSWETPLDISAEDAEIIKMKSEMKSLIRNIDGEKDHYEYKMGFVIDPDHDGEYNHCAYYAGTDNNGREAQYIFQNGTYSIQFSTNYDRDNGTAYMDNAYLYIWCDDVTGKDYIVRCATDESGNITAKDCCTNEIIYTIINGELTLFGQKTQDKIVLDKGKYYFRSAAPCDKDHFIVSKNGKAEMQGA